MTLIQDYTYQLLNTGVILNGDPDINGNFIDVTKVSGLDRADIRTVRRTRLGTYGGFVDAQYEDMRTIVIEGTIYSSYANIELLLDTLKDNYAPTVSPVPFFFYHPIVGSRFVNVKSISIKYDIDSLRRTGSSAFQIQMIGEDPTIYGPSTSLSGGIASPSSGRSYPRSYNFGYGITAGSAGAINAINVGNKPVTAVITLQNVINPTIVNDTQGLSLKFNITVTGTDSLSIELRNRTVYLNGTANRRGTVLGGSQWFLLNKGNNQLRFLGTGSGGTPQMTVTYNPGYW